jgi:hypothetical protein
LKQAEARLDELRSIVDVPSILSLLGEHGRDAPASIMGSRLATGSTILSFSVQYATRTIA